jgi:hypothetical protein
MHRSGVHQFMSEAEGGDRQAIATLHTQKENQNVLCMISEAKYCTGNSATYAARRGDRDRPQCGWPARCRLRGAVAGASRMLPKMYVNYVDRTFSPPIARFLAPPRFP